MASQDTSKERPKELRSIVKSNAAKKQALLSTTSSNCSTFKSSIINRKTTEQKVNNTVTMESRQCTKSVPTAVIPNNGKKTVPVPGSGTKRVKKYNSQRRPKPAHSGVPVPEKMKKLLHMQLFSLDCSKTDDSTKPESHC